MRLPIRAALVLLCFLTAFSQSKPVVQDKGNFGLHVVNDYIKQPQYLERQNQLLLIGSKNLQLLDLTNFRVIETRPLNETENGKLKVELANVELPSWGEIASPV